MRIHQGSRYRAMTFATLFLVGAIARVFAQATNPPSVSGTIASINGSNLVLTLADGTQKQVALQDSTTILERVVAGVGEIRPGDMLGVAARISGQELIATSINIFAREMQTRARLGQFPMQTGEVMTNATVTDYVQAVQGHTLTMKYNDGSATITVPDGVPIHRLVSLKPDALAAGLQIVVRGTLDSDGALKAASISFDGQARG